MKKQSNIEDDKNKEIGIIYWYRKNISQRVVLSRVIFLIYMSSSIVFVVFGTIKDNLILYTTGIVLLTAILTKSVDNYYLTRKEQEDRISKLRKKIRIFLFLFENEHKSLGSSIKEISKYLITEILPSKKAFSETIYLELGELYGLSNSIDVNPSTTCKNYKDIKREDENRRYKIKDMERIIELCKEHKDIK